MCHVRVAEARDDMWDCRQDNEGIKAGPQFVQGYERNFILKTKLSALIPADACWQICNCPIVHLEPGLCKDCGGGGDSCHLGQLGHASLAAISNQGARSSICR